MQLQQQNSFKAYFIPLLNSLDEAVIDGTCKHRQTCDTGYGFVFFADIDTDAVESYVAEETIEFLVNVEESVVDDE